MQACAVRLIVHFQGQINYLPHPAGASALFDTNCCDWIGKAWAEPDATAALASAHEEERFVLHLGSISQPLACVQTRQSAIIAVLEEQYRPAEPQPHGFIATPNLLMRAALLFSAPPRTHATTRRKRRKKGGRVANSDSRGQSKRQPASCTHCLPTHRVKQIPLFEYFDKFLFAQN
ncbi:hypothetical protein MHYP_G00334720 [Metynnis hypsauchen]